MTARLSRQSADLSSDLTVQLECSDAAEATVPSVWTIPANQASAPADFPIDAIRDWIVDGDKSVTITASVDDHVQGSDTVVVEDVDVAGASVSRAAVDVSEDGVTDTYQVSLTSKPEAEVEISLDPDGQVSIADPAAGVLRFTADNWDQPQTVTVAAVDDGVVEGDHTGLVEHAAESNDSNYHGIDIGDVAVNITDNDSAHGVRVDPTTVYVTEDGATGTYQVRLESRPAADVEVSLNPDGQVSITDPAGSTLVFTADNWDQPQVVTVAAVDDTDVECGHTGTITHTAQSGDPDHDQITINDVTAVIADNDQQSLGRIDYLRLEDLDPSAGDLCYRCETTRQGFLTIEAVFDPDLGDVQLTLYDHQGSELATSSPQGGNERIDWPAGAAGETYYLKVRGTNDVVDLRLVNLVRVSPDGYQVTMFGTQEHDEFEFDAHALSSAIAAVHQIAIKGVEYEFTFPLSPGMPTFFVTFDGGPGTDGATLTGSDGTDAATLYPTSGRMVSAGHAWQDYEVRVSGVASLKVYGGGGDDEVDLHDSPGNDFFAAASNFGEMSIPAEPFFYEPEPASNPDPGVGFNLVSWWNFGNDGPAVWEQAVVDLYEHGFRHVSLIPFRFVDPATGVVSTDPMPEKVPDVAHVAAGIHKANELGMTVTVNPFVETPDFSPRGQLEFPNAAAAAQFFDDYEVFLVEVARAAADNGAHRMMIGSELSRLVQNPDYQDDWGRLIDAVAAEFTGGIGYAANWDQYTDPHLTATIWENPAIDFMGVDAYFQLANEQQADDSAAYPDEPFIGQIMDNREQGVSGWQQHVDEVLTFAAQRKGGSGMPLVFTEHGLIPYNRSTTMPFSDAPAATEPPDPAEQTNAYDALLRATNHLGGLLEEIQFWHWGMPGSEGSHWYTHPDAADHLDTTADESLGNRAGRFLSDYVSTAVPEPATLVLRQGFFRRLRRGDRRRDRRGQVLRLARQ